MKFSIITLFPEMFHGVLNLSILGRGQKRGALKFQFLNLRDYGIGKHQVVDDRPFGGGVGMVLRADVLTKAVKTLLKGKSKPKILLMSASGKPFIQKDAKRLSKERQLVIICGHYEGVDQRFIDKYVTEEISIGDFVLTGGEIAAMAVMDSISRLIPKVLTKKEALIQESFENNLLEYPQFTRPQVFEKIKVPDILVSGNHQAVDKWRHQKQVENTAKIRPDLK